MPSLKPCRSQPPAPAPRKAKPRGCLTSSAVKQSGAIAKASGSRDLGMIRGNSLGYTRAKPPSFLLVCLEIAFSCDDFPQSRRLPIYLRGARRSVVKNRLPRKRLPPSPRLPPSLKLRRTSRRTRRRAGTEDREHGKIDPPQPLFRAPSRALCAFLRPYPELAAKRRRRRKSGEDRGRRGRLGRPVRLGRPEVSSSVASVISCSNPDHEQEPTEGTKARAILVPGCAFVVAPGLVVLAGRSGRTFIRG